MPRPRSPENRGLPERWCKHHGAFYYQVPPGLEAHWDGKRKFRLGATLPEAYRVWAERLAVPDEMKTVGQLLDTYALRVVPTKKPKSREEAARYIVNLKKVFDAVPMSGFKPAMVYKYVDRRSQKATDPNTGKTTGGRTIAHREMELLSHAFTKAVEWGLIDRHPFKGEVRLEGEAPRDRYVEDWEVVECLALPSRRKKGSVLAIQAYVRLKLLTGMARSDLLRLRLDEHLREDGIHIQRHKTAESTGKRTIYEWCEELREAVALAKAVRPALSPFLFCTREGRGYINEETEEAHGWDSMWQRFMDRVLKDTKVTARFTEHDLRAKCASDAPSLEHARMLLSHADARTTQRVYRRKPERVQLAQKEKGAG